MLNNNISEYVEVSKIIFTFDYELDLKFDLPFSFLINNYNKKIMKEYVLKDNDETEYVEDKDDKLNIQNELDYINYFKNKNKLLIDSGKELEEKVTSFFFDTVIFSKKGKFVLNNYDLLLNSEEIRNIYSLDNKNALKDKEFNKNAFKDLIDQDLNHFSIKISPLRTFSVKFILEEIIKNFLNLNNNYNYLYYPEKKIFVINFQK